MNATVFLPQSIQQWNFVNLQNEKDSLMIYHVKLGSYHKCTVADKTVCQASLVLDNKVTSILLQDKMKFSGDQLDEFSGYKIPKSISHVLQGRTVDGDEIKITLDLALDNLIDKVDILAQLPYLIRLFIQTFITAPFCYQWVEQATATIDIGGQVREISGLTFAETTFLAATRKDV